MVYHRSQFGRRLVLSLGGTLVLSGCFGSFGALRGLWAWNDDMGSKWVKWLVFLGLSIIPVYELFGLADVFVLNSVEFWTGSNPVGNAGDGRTVRRVATADPDVLKLEVERAGRIEYVAFCRRVGDGELQILDASGKRLTAVREQSDGSLELRTGNDVLLARLERDAAERVYGLVEAGAPAHHTLERELGSSAWQIARLREESVAIPRVL